MTESAPWALVTGSSGNVGKAICEKLAQNGFRLWLVDLPETNGDAHAADVSRRYGTVAIFVDCDLEVEESRQRVIDLVRDRKAGLSALVNNAALVGSSDLTGWVSPFQEQSLTTWRRALEVNLTAVFHLIQGLSTELREAAPSSVVNIASTHGLLGPKWALYDGTSMGSPAAYSISKAGVIHLTRWLAATMAPQVRVNSVSPGGIYRDQPREFVERYEAETPMNRLGNEKDVADAVSFLLSGEAHYITGQNLVVDGGYTIT